VGGGGRGRNTNTSVVRGTSLEVAGFGMNYAINPRVVIFVNQSAF
jgi:hypothetical protein